MEGRRHAPEQPHGGFGAGPDALRHLFAAGETVWLALTAQPSIAVSILLQFPYEPGTGRHCHGRSFLCAAMGRTGAPRLVLAAEEARAGSDRGRTPSRRGQRRTSCL